MSLYYYIWISNIICPGLYCLFCSYWYNCSPSYLKLSFHNHISHRIVEYKKEYWLNIFMFCKLQHGKQNEFDTYRWVRLVKSLNVPDWIDVMLLACKSLQNIKYVLNTMIIWDSIRIEKVGRHHLCNLPEPTYQRTKVNKRENKRQTIVHIRKLKLPHTNLI